LRGGAAEAIEIVAKGDEKSSKVVGKTIQQIRLPPGTTIGAIVRGEEVLIAHSDTRIQAEDHVVLFLVNKRYISGVEALFQLDAIAFF
jgi:trk system potassium uptake protein TrkA